MRRFSRATTLNDNVWMMSGGKQSSCGLLLEITPQPIFRSLTRRLCRVFHRTALIRRPLARAAAPDRRYRGAAARCAGRSEGDETHAFEALEHPAHGGPVCRLLELVGDRLAGGGELRTKPVLGEAVDQEAQHHHQTERDDAWGFFTKTEDARNSGSLRKLNPRSTLPWSL